MLAQAKYYVEVLFLNDFSSTVGVLIIYLVQINGIHHCCVRILSINVT